MSLTNKKVDRLAVLIDAENISARYVGPLFHEVARLGTATAKRIYGDWTLPEHGRWKQTLSAHAIMPVHQFRSTSGKNSTDFALIIDAMDLLYTGKFEGFCIVSSDGDFTRLACRIRESGLRVYGFGEAKTPAAFVKACDRFIKLEILSVTDAPVAKSIKSGPETAEAKARSAKLKPPGDAEISWTPIETPASSEACSPPSKVAANHELISLVKTAYDSVSGEDGWASLATFGAHLLELSPSFDCRGYGTKRLGEFVQATGIFEIKKVPNPNQPTSTSWYIKTK